MLCAEGGLPILTLPFREMRTFCADMRGWERFRDQMNRIPAKTCNVNREGVEKG
jgi:hypothetical protein